MNDVNLRTLQDLRDEGAPQFFDTDQSSIKRRLIAKFEADTNKTLFEGQPEMFMIETMAYSLAVRSSAEQNAVLQNTIVWSQGRHIEDNAANVSIFRLLAQPARTTIRFFREAEDVGQSVILQQGLIVASGNIEFSIDNDVVLQQGEIDVSVTATAIVAGVAANGIAEFAINRALDGLPDGVSAHNTTVSFGGSDIEDYERLRDRAANGNFRISKGGPRNGYREIVKGIHPDIVDVSVVKPEPGRIHIYPLMRTGLPSAEIKELILKEIDQDEDVPMGDYLSIRDLTPVIHNFKLIIRVDAADNTLVVAGREKAVQVFNGWSQETGVRIAPSSITSEVSRLAGVIDAETDGLEFKDLRETEYAVLGNLTVEMQVRPNA